MISTEKEKKTKQKKSTQNINMMLENYCHVLGGTIDDWWLYCGTGLVLHLFTTKLNWNEISKETHKFFVSFVYLTLSFHISCYWWIEFQRQSILGYGNLLTFQKSLVYILTNPQTLEIPQSYLRLILFIQIWRWSSWKLKVLFESKWTGI